MGTDGPSCWTRAGFSAGSSPGAILASLPYEAQEQILAQLPRLPRFTPHTVLDPEILRTELAETPQRGYSIRDPDDELGARGAGAPILGPHQRVVGGISVGGPIGRIPVEMILELGELVKEEAKIISRQLARMTF